MLTDRLDSFYEVSAQEIQDDTKGIESDTEPEKPSGIFEVKEIVANTIDDITGVVTEAITEPNDKSDDNTETESIKTPSLKNCMIIPNGCIPLICHLI